MNTRILQDILRLEQIRLGTTVHPFMRGVIKKRIQNIAAELLYRWRESMKELT